MSKNTVAIKFDKIALNAALFMLLLILFGKLFDKILQTVLVSCLSLLSLHMVWHAITRPIRQRGALKKEDNAKINLISQNLIYFSNSYLKSFFNELFISASYEVTQKNDYLIVTKDDISYVVIFNFEEKPIDVKIVQQAEQLKNELETDFFIILCNSFTSEAKNILKSILSENSKIYCKNSIYRQMKKSRIFPETPYKAHKTKNSFKKVLAYAFNRTRFKNYFFLGLIMYLFSYITPFKMYYLVFSAFLFTLSLFCMINRKYNTSKTISYEDF